MKCRMTLFTLIFSLALSPTLFAAEDTFAPEAASGFQPQQTAIPQTGSAEHFLAATANDYATQAATAMLRKGGSAVDAAIAAQMVLGLVEPQSSGIGGGAFMLYWDQAKQNLHAFDGRETAPLAIDDRYFLLPPAPISAGKPELPPAGKPEAFLDAVIGGHSVGTPGVVRMLALTHRRFGKLPWASLFQPAIQLAEQGFPISPRLNTLLRETPKLATNPDLVAYFFDADGDPKAVGTMLKNPAYAATLKLLAQQGEKVFYEGTIARAVVDKVQHNAHRPGPLALADLKRYRAIERDPICTSFHEYSVCGLPPPSSGGTTVLAILGLLERFPSDALKPESTSFYHLFAEASALAFADRDTYLGDPDFVSVPAQGLIAPDYLAARSHLIDPQKALPKPAPGQPQWSTKAAAINYRQAASPERISTSQLNIVDAAGNALTMTTTIEGAFGSRLMVGGFVLNNQLTDFSFAPLGADGKLVANRIQPGKRPRSSMAPTMVFKQGKPVLLAGSPGGARIIDYVAKTLMYILEADTPLDKALASPHIVALGTTLELETGRVGEEQKQTLRALGHTLVEADETSGLSAIRIGGAGLNGTGFHETGLNKNRTTEKLSGANDPRREGSVRGD